MKNILVLLSFFPSFVCAQKQYEPFTHFRSAVSFNPFALAEIDFTILFGHDYKLAPKFYLSNEAGYIFASQYIGEATNKGTGFIIRPSLKFFVSENNKFYLQPQIFYKQVTHKMYDWVGKEAVNGVPAYEELQEFKYRRKITGYNVVAGFVLPLELYKRGYIDFYFGIGVRNKKSMVVESNTDYQRPTGIFAPVDNGVFAGIPMGIRFIYALH